ncbi:MAG: type II toxin-antitoxin system RelB/DinJ family antitoxin [Clostridia bacterium]|nr:type II toxin-antitoxin system RelB/DinJ family antitoxin [Clostridia bacterium]
MTQVSFRIDEQVKTDAEKALKAMGLNLSTAITIFLTKVGREQRIPFEITADPFYSESNMEYIKRSIKQFEEGKIVTKTMEELEAMANE